LKRREVVLVVETGFSYLRKNLRRTIMRVRENLGLRSEPLLLRFRAYEPHKPVEEVEVYEREAKTEAEAEKPAEEPEAQEVRPKEVARELREVRERPARTLIEDIIAYRREHGIMASVRRILEASARQAEMEVARAQAQAQDQEARRREEALRQEVERLRQELKRLQGAHY
jgi:uncharacterized membrane protein YccC